MKMYFEGLTEEKAIKARYKELAKQFHPDLGGDKAIMQEINAQYESVLMGHYQKKGKSFSEIEKLMKENVEAMGALNSILGLPGLVIELCGSWIWVSGDTKAVKERLKASKFFWSPNKLAWYWRPSEAKMGWNRRGVSLDEIRFKYGSMQLKGVGAIA